jgi:hypothetical protein
VENGFQKRKNEGLEVTSKNTFFGMCSNQENQKALSSKRGTDKVFCNKRKFFV